MEVKDSRHLKFESEKVEPRVYNFDITEEE